MRGRAAWLLTGLALGVTLAGCSSEPEPLPTAARTHTPITIAFAGDVHFAGVRADRLSNPSTAMGPLTSVLAEADLGILNLETAVTARGAAQAKQFTFRAPPVVFEALKDAGVDVVTMANNHALDYGPSSVPDALAAAQTAGMPVVGLGADEQQAFAPWVTTVRDQRVAVLGATARTLAADLVAAGADIVVGQHGNVLLGGGYLGAAYVHYGMGNFQFYASNGGTKTETGILVLTAAGRRVSGAKWHPGRIVHGLPTPLTGTAAATATARRESLRGCAGLSAEPTPQAG